MKKVLEYFSYKKCLKRRASDVGASAAMATVFCIFPPCWPIYIITRRSILPMCSFVFLSILSGFIIKPVFSDLFGIDLSDLNWAWFDLVILFIGARLSILLEQKIALKKIKNSFYILENDD